MKNLKLVLAVLIFSIAGSSIAQTSTLLPQNSAGFGTNFGVVKAAGFQGYMYELGFNYYALSLDLGVMDIAYDRELQQILTENAKSLSKSISVSYWFLDARISERVFMKVGLTAGLDFVSFDNYEFYKFKQTNYGNLYTKYKLNSRIREGLGFKSFVNINLENNWTFQPNLYFGYKFSQEDLLRLNLFPNEWDPKEKANSNMSETILGFSLGKTFKKDMQVFISMKQYLYPIYKDNFTYMAVGFAFPLADSE